MSSQRKMKKKITREMVQTAKRLIDQDKKTSEIKNILDLSKAATCKLIRKIVEGGDDVVKNYQEIDFGQEEIRGTNQAYSPR